MVNLRPSTCLAKNCRNENKKTHNQKFENFFANKIAIKTNCIRI